MTNQVLNTISESMELTENDNRYWSDELGWVSVPSKDDDGQE